FLLSLFLSYCLYSFLFCTTASSASFAVRIHFFVLFFFFSVRSQVQRMLLHGRPCAQGRRPLRKRGADSTATVCWCGCWRSAQSDSRSRQSSPYVDVV